MRQVAAFLTGTQVGLGLMYLLDPYAGKRRRAQLRDKGEHFSKRFEEEIRRSGRDLKHRSIGKVAEARSAFRQEDPSDELIHERVRSTIGRCTVNPSAIEVLVDDGRVTLEGLVLAEEFNDVIRGVSRVRGVESVHSRLEIHEEPDVPSLQGEARRPSRAWKPATRLITGSMGTGLLVAGLARRRAEGIIYTTGGSLLLLRSMTNLPLRDLVGFRRGRRRLFHFQKSIVIDAPVDEVFSAFSNFENWPLFMEKAHEIRNLGQGLSHWTYAGPGGVLVDWETELVDCIPNETLSWRSVRGAAVGQVGEVSFQPSGDGERTRIHFRLAYYPPGGALGHILGTVFGAAPRRTLHQDLLRFKTLLEHGHTRIRGHRVDASELRSESSRRRRRSQQERISRESLTFRQNEPLH